ncbi:MAG: ABC transporter ATP-binding protein [Bacillota bacterium]|nr:sugar ABC transporter ATP-binding protein [Bacillota bacterium]REJ34731.1 MAG: sugar ABC transporter ATP-binding protein [Bacillota bacterium]
MARIRLERLTKSFGNVTAVKGVDLEINDGELLALLGPSGCGKTTILLMLAGIYRPTSGDIYFDDERVNDVPPKGRGVGLVFQSYALYPHMTVYDNIAFPLRLRKTPKEEIDRRVREVARIAKIEEYLQRKPSQLSGGQQQRVALCRALVKEPELLLLDEPLSNLDARLRIETRTEIKRLQRQLGITTILVTHDQIEAMTMADRVAVMRAGVIEQLSTPLELYNRPANLFVASFIGDPPMNLVSMEYRVDGGTPQLANADFSVALPPEARAGMEKATSSQVVLGVRPEDLRVSSQPVDGKPAGEVYMLEPLGRDTLVDVRVGQQAIRALVPGGTPIRVGDRVWLDWDMDRMHLFDARTEGRLPVSAGGERAQAAGA